MHGALDDTICAIATPPGEGGIGVVRISGLQAVDVASQVVRLRSGKSLHDLQTHVMALADVGSPGALQTLSLIHISEPTRPY